MASLEGDSSPGFPLMRLAAKNSQLIDAHRDLVIDLAMTRLELLARADPQSVRGMSAEECVRRGLCDEVRVFVKNELHSCEKVQQGRMRIIMSISVIDQLVERVLNSRQNNLEISQWHSIPSKPGLGLHDEGLAALEKQIFALPNPIATDVSGFDWSVAQWALDLDAEVRADLSAAGSLSRALLNRATVLGNSRIVFSDGIVWDQVVRGVQKSGSYNTSSTNSRIRVALMHFTAIERGENGLGLAMGDDAVERCDDATDLERQYERLGYNLKDASREIEFCSYKFHGGGKFEPVRWHKMLAGLLSTPVRDVQHGVELYEALRYELRHSPFLPKLDPLLRAVGWTARKEIDGAL